MVEALGLALPLLLTLGGVGFLIMEALAPGAHSFVVGIAFLLAGIVGLAFPGTVLAAPLGLAAMSIVFAAGAFYAYRKTDIYGGAGEDSTSDVGSLKGKEGVVTEAVTTDGGEIKLEDGGFNPFYRARTIEGEIPEGERVMVIDPGGGNVVTVETVGGVTHDAIDRELAREERGRERDTETETERA